MGEHTDTWAIQTILSNTVSLDSVRLSERVKRGDSTEVRAQTRECVKFSKSVRILQWLGKQIINGANALTEQIGSIAERCDEYWRHERAPLVPPSSDEGRVLLGRRLERVEEERGDEGVDGGKYVRLQAEKKKKKTLSE